MKEPVFDTPLFDSRGSFFLLVFCYVAVVASMGVIGIFVSFLPRIAQDLAISKAQAGLALSLFSVPSALACLPIGGRIDRIGIRLGRKLEGVGRGGGGVRRAVSTGRGGP